jgi:UDP-N-acetylmuramoyl-tripeptide--D-alanyl-D-alanine ligase
MMTLAEAAMAMAGTLHGIDRHFIGVSTDTRALKPGEVFLALKGERFDALDFVTAACRAGAAGAVVGAGDVPPMPPGTSVIRVDDTRAALGRLAAYWRKRFAGTLVALTGSNGKTTVKDMIAAVLQAQCADPARVLATEGNLNNDIGVPLTLLRLREPHRYAVVEMGMNHAGEIRYLTGLARPDVALVNNAGTAHIGMLGSREAIARAKGEIYEGLDDRGIALINADDAHAGMWRELNAHRTVLDFALDVPAAITGTYTGHALHSDIRVQTPRGAARFRLGVPGVHNVRNAIAAAAAGVALGVAPETIALGLGGFRGPKGRMQQSAGRRGCTLIDDTYNANPDSTLAAIAVLAGQRGKRILVLGDMGELGAEAMAQHRAVGTAARAAGIECLFALGELSAATVEAYGAGGRHFDAIDALIDAVASELVPGATVLVKGSRFMRMERVVQALGADAQ